MFNEGDAVALSKESSAKKDFHVPNYTHYAKNIRYYNTLPLPAAVAAFKVLAPRDGQA